MNRKNRKRTGESADPDADDLRDTRFDGNRGVGERGELRGGVKQVLLIVLALHVIYVIGLVIFNQFNSDEPEAQAGEGAAETATAPPPSPGVADPSGAGPDPGSTGSAGSQRYTVRSGDNLYAIARRYGLSAQQLAQANDLQIDDVLQPGTELLIPQGQASANAGGNGSSLEQLIESAPRAQPAEPAIIPEDDVDDPIAPRGIVGVQLGLFEEGELAAESGETSGSGSQNPGQGQSQPQASGDTYKVRSGDTVWSIAKKFGTSPQKLQSLNNIADPSKLQVGQTLKIPQG